MTETTAPASTTMVILTSDPVSNRLRADKEISAAEDAQDYWGVYNRLKELEDYLTLPKPQRELLDPLLYNRACDARIALQNWREPVTFAS